MSVVTAPPSLASLEAVAKYGTATAPLPSLAIGGGDKEDGDAGDEATDVWERDIVCIGTQSRSHPRI
jgi:hypothetical protein